MKLLKKQTYALLDHARLYHQMTPDEVAEFVRECGKTRQSESEWR